MKPAALESGQFWTPRPIELGWGFSVAEQPPLPAAGSPFTFTIPARKLVRLTLARFSFSGLAIGETATFAVLIQEGETVLVTARVQLKHEVGGVNVLLYMASAAPTAPFQVKNVATFTFPDLLLQPGWTFKVEQVETVPALEWKVITLFMDQFDALRTLPGDPFEENESRRPAYR